MPRVEQLTVSEEQAGNRLDLVLAQVLTGVSRTYIQDLIAGERVQVNNSVSRRGSYRLRPGDLVTVTIPDPEAVEIRGEDIPLDIVYEDEYLLVINKPQGMVVHPAHGHWRGTLVNALLGQTHDLSGINGELRPGIVHRLDKDTSGLLVVAKNDIAHRVLAERIKEHDFTREYTALVHGKLAETLGTVDAPIARDPRDRKKMAVVKEGRPAITHYQVVSRYREYTLLKVTLETGRTHQIRVHLSYIGHPVAGDTVYGPRKPHLGLKGQALHASRLGFVHPITGQYLEFAADLPDWFKQVLAKLDEK